MLGTNTAPGSNNHRLAWCMHICIWYGQAEHTAAASRGGPHVVHEDEHGVVVLGQAREVCAHGRRAVRIKRHAALALQPGAQRKAGVAVVRLAAQVHHAHAAVVQTRLHHLRKGKARSRTCPMQQRHLRKRH